LRALKTNDRILSAMLKIKLVRTGKRNAPTYRVVVQESKSKLTGSVVQGIGYLVPKENGKHETKIDKKLYQEWIKKGAVPTESVVLLVEGKYKYKKYSPKDKEDKGKNDQDTVKEEGVKEEAELTESKNGEN